MTISTEERDIIARILDHSANGTTDMLPDVMPNPVTRYTDPAQLDAEMKTLFRNFPIIIAHSSEIAEPGDFMTNEDFGVPIIVEQNGRRGVFVK